jgi:hypothetical protein
MQKENNFKSEEGLTGKSEWRGSYKDVTLC